MSYRNKSVDLYFKSVDWFRYVHDFTERNFEQTTVLTNEITSTLHKTAAKHAMYLRKEGQQRKEKEL